MGSTVETDVATVGPEDVDAPGELAPKVVKQQAGHELINLVRGNYPLDLVILEQRDEDRPRTAALDADEVLEAIRDAFGDEKDDGGVVKLLSARVRGAAQPVEEKAVCVLWETPSGRTARGAIGYSDLGTSVDRFDSMVARGEVTEVDETDPKDLQRTVERQENLIKRLQAKAEGKDTEGLDGDSIKKMIEEAVSGQVDEAIAAKDAEIERLNTELAEARTAGQAERPGTEDLTKQDAADAASTTRAEAEAAAGKGGDPEPVTAPEGNAKELIAASRAGEYSVEQLDALIAAEKAAETPRSTVIDAAEAAKRKAEED